MDAYSNLLQATLKGNNMDLEEKTSISSSSVQILLICGYLIFNFLPNIIPASLAEKGCCVYIYY